MLIEIVYLFGSGRFQSRGSHLPREQVLCSTHNGGVSLYRGSLAADMAVLKRNEEGVSASGNWLLLVFLLANGLRLFVVGLLPTGIGVVLAHRFGDNFGLFAEILLIHHSILANDECHYAR